MEAWEVLERAADKIERDGHAKHRLLDCSGRYCAMGAVNKAYHGTAYYPAGLDPNRPIAEQLQLSHPVLREALLALHRAKASDEEIADWNNAPERTGAEVAATMRAAALTLRAAARTEATRQHAPQSTVAEVATGDAGALEHVS